MFHLSLSQQGIVLFQFFIGEYHGSCLCKELELKKNKKQKTTHTQTFNHSAIDILQENSLPDLSCSPY